MTRFCPNCGRIAEYYPNNDGTSCTCCIWYFCGKYEFSTSDIPAKGINDEKD
jgi:hypothetical protein